MERTPSTEELIRIVGNITSSIGLERGALPTEAHVEPIKEVCDSGNKAGGLGCYAAARQRAELQQWLICGRATWGFSHTVYIDS